MNLTLYKVTADRRSLDKITGVAPVFSSVALYPFREVSVISPVFEVDYNAAYLTCNYLHCDLYDRYYYIQDMQVNTAGRLNIRGYIDVRQSFKAAISGMSCTVIRGAQQPDQIPDDKLPVNPARKDITSIVMQEVNRSFNVNAPYSYLLTVVGGEPNINRGGEQ